MSDGSVKIDVSLDTKNFVREINGMGATAKTGLQKLNDAISSSQNKLKQLEETQSSLTKQVEEAKQKLAQQGEALKKAEGNTTSLTKEYEKQKDELNKLEKELEETNNAVLKQKEHVVMATSSWVSFKTKMSDVSKQMEQVSASMKAIGNSITSVGTKMTLGITAPIVAMGTASVKAAIDFESAFAGVRKTTEATEEEYKVLEKGIIDLSKVLPATAVEISNVAEAAGQLGIKKESLIDFTKTMIDLGETTNLTADEAATQFARFANIMKMPQEEFDRLGSTVVELGNNLATTEAEIVTMGMRLAGAGKQIGLTESGVMSFAGALSSVGIEAEAGGTAFSKLMIEMSLAVETGNASLKDFADVTGMTTDEFTRAFKEDASGAILDFIKGLNKMGIEGDSVIKILDDMGITETRMRDAILRAAGASDVFTEALDLGSKAWEENTALSKEASQRYATMESRMKMLKNQIVAVGKKIGEILMPYVERLVEAIGKAVAKFDAMDEASKKSIIKFLAIAAAIGPLLVVLGVFISSLGSVVGAIALVTNAISIMGATATLVTTPTVILANAFTFLSSSAFLIPAAIVAVVVALAEFTPIGESAYAILVALGTAFAVIKGAQALQAIITGVAKAFAIQTTATEGATIANVAHSVVTKTVALGSALASAAVGVLSGTMTISAANTAIATAATALFCVTLNAAIWPITLIVAGIAGLVAGFKFLSDKMNTQNKETKQYTDETKNLVKKQKELVESIKKSDDAYKDNIVKVQSQAGANRILAKSIFDLSEVENKSVGQKELLKQYVAELNEAVPELSLSYDEETDSLNKNIQQTELYLQAKEDELMLTAQFEAQKKVIQDMARTEAELAVTRARLAEATIKFDEADWSAIGTKKELVKSITELEESEKDLVAAQEFLTETYDILNISIEETATKVENSKNKMAEAQEEEKKAAEENLTDIEKINKERADSEVELTKKLEEEAAARGLTLDEYKKELEEMVKAHDEYVKSISNGLERLKIDSKGSLADLNSILLENQKDIDNWINNLNMITDAGLEQYAHILREQGVEKGGAYAAEIANSIKIMEEKTGESFASFVNGAAELPSAFESGLDETQYAAVAGLLEVEREFSNSGKSVPQAFTNNFEAGIPEAVEVGRNLTKQVSEVLTKDKSIENAGTDIIKNSKTAMSNQVNKSNFPELGRNMADGVIEGLDSKTSAAKAAGARLGSAVETGYREATETHSPSKVMIEAAHDTADGVIVGTNDKLGEVARSGEELASSYIESVKEEFDTGLSEASVIMLGQWTDINQGMTDIVKMTGADRLQAQIDSLDKLIKATEEKNEDLAKQEEIAAKERAVKEATNNKDRIKAQEDLNKTIAKNDLDALKDKRDRLKEEVEIIKEAYQAMSDAIVSALKEKYSQEKEMSISALDSEVSRRKEASKAIIEQYEREYDAKLKTLDIEESEEVRALQMQIDALDEQTNAEERALKEQSNQQKLFDLEQKIMQAESEEDRIQAQELYNKEFKKQQREALLQQRNDEKNSLKIQISQIKDNYKKQRDEAKQSLDNQKQEYRQREEATSQFLKNETSKINDHYEALTNKTRLEAEARKLMIDNNQKEIVSILNKYTPDWATAGQSAGEAFLSALQGITPSIESEVDRIMSLINQASQAKEDLAVSISEVEATNETSIESKPQQTQQTYTVKAGDTLSAIASKYGLTVSELRDANGLSQSDDRKLQIGKNLKIPILHTGGVSLKEQLALIDNREAVAPLADLYSMMENAVMTTANKLVAGFTNSIKNVTNNVTTNNDNGINFVMNYQGEMSRNEAYNTGRIIAEQTVRELRSRGVNIVGGGA